mmetsp:Transcript_59795/g.129534  ORF Transcript_59795/g.129534 Transcript_59795/m.129534 type:complete len:259 (-) Transcript_59795:1131-1907(-)
MRAGRKPKSNETPKAPALSIAWKKSVGFTSATASGGSNARPKDCSLDSKVSSFTEESLGLKASWKRSVKASTKPMKEVTIALSEKPRTHVDTNPPDSASTCSGSVPAGVSRGMAARMAAFQVKNIRHGTRLPKMIACVILERSPSSCTHTVGITLWKTNDRRRVGIVLVKLPQSATAKRRLGSPRGAARARRTTKAATTQAAKPEFTSSSTSVPLNANRKPPKVKAKITGGGKSSAPRAGRKLSRISPPRETYATMSA